MWDPAMPRWAPAAQRKKGAPGFGPEAALQIMTLRWTEPAFDCVADQHGLPRQVEARARREPVERHEGRCGALAPSALEWILADLREARRGNSPDFQKPPPADQGS